MVNQKLREWQSFYFNWITKYEDVLDWNQLSKNKNISMEIIENYPNKPWNYWFVSQNPNLNKKFIINHQDKNLYWSYIAEHIKLDQELIQLIHSKLYSIISLCKNPSINIRQITCNSFDWDYNILAGYFKINKWTLKIFGDYEFLSFNKNLRPRIIESEPNIQWNYYALSENPNITEKFVEKNLDKNWNWYYLSKNENISIRFILENGKNDYINWKALSARKDLDYEILIDYPESSWYWQIISKSKNEVPFQFVQDLNLDVISKWFYYQSLEEYSLEDIDFLNKNVHYYDSLSKNDMVDYGKMKDIKVEYLQFYYLSQNKKLTFDFIDTHITQRWDFPHLSNHNFEYQKQLFFTPLNI